METETTGEVRRVAVPPHRMNALRADWEQVTTALTTQLELQVRMNLTRRCVEVRGSDTTALQRAEEFLRALMAGFAVGDAVALLRVEGLYLDSFEVRDVRTLRGDHFSRAVGRMAGTGGRIKHAVENATQTRIVVADTRVHLLGTVAGLKLAREALSALILGRPPARVQAQLRQLGARREL